MKSARPISSQRLLYHFAVDAGGAQADVRLDRAGKEERILEDDAEHAAQVLDIDFADVDAVEEDLSALDVVEAEEQRDQSGLAGAGVADDGDGLARCYAEGDIAEDPVLFGGLGFVGVAEPDVAEFDFAAGGFEADGVGGRDRGGWFVEEFEDALGGGHGGLQDVEFFAEVLDRAKEARRVHRESGEDAEAQRAVEYAIAARPIDEGYREDAEDFHGWIKEREGEDGVAPCQHVVAIAAAKFGAGFLFAVEELHDAHAGNVFLEIGVDAGNGGTNAAVGVAHEQAEEIGDYEDEGEDGEGVEGEATVDGKKPAGEDREEEEVVDHGDDAGGEKIVEGVDVGGNAGDQAADRVAVEVASWADAECG